MWRYQKRPCPECPECGRPTARLHGASYWCATCALEGSRLRSSGVMAWYRYSDEGDRVRYRPRQQEVTAR